MCGLFEKRERRIVAYDRFGPIYEYVKIAKQKRTKPTNLISKRRLWLAGAFGAAAVACIVMGAVDMNQRVAETLPSAPAPELIYKEDAERAHAMQESEPPLVAAKALPAAEAAPVAAAAPAEAIEPSANAGPAEKKNAEPSAVPVSEGSAYANAKDIPDEIIPIANAVDAIDEPMDRVAEPTPEPMPAGRYVWIPQNGKKYHSDPSCSNMKHPSKVSLAEAQSSGYEQCSKCY